MNFDFYLLGTPDGYNQYPLDNKADLFRSFHDEVKSDTQMTIWRNADVVYYVYTRNLRTAGKNQYFGMVIALNGLYLTNIGNVLSVFEQLCSNIALRGRILKIDKTGKIQFVHSRFIDTPDEIETTVRECRELVETNLRDDLRHLPEEYIVQRRAVSIAYDDGFNDSKLHNLLKEYNCIHFTNADNKDVEYFDEIIARLYEENRNLKEQYRRLNSQKKQYRFVIILFILLVIVGGTLFAVNHYVHLKHVEIQQKNDTITSQSARIQDQNDTIVRQKGENEQLSQENMLLNDSVAVYGDSLTLLKQKVRQQQSKISELSDELALQELDFNNLKRTIGQTYPLLISSVQMGNLNSDGSKETDYGNRIYSSYTYYLEPRIEYRGFTTGNVFLKMKLYLPDGTLWRDNASLRDCTRTSRISSTMNATKKINTSDFRVSGGYRGYWRRGTYRIEFWYNDRVCLYSGTFNIE